jgi:hypothetical protein
MKRIRFAVMSLAIALPQAQAQQPSTTATAPTSTGADSQTAFNALPGRWVRVEGGYVITIRAVEADGNALRLFFELRAGGYGGSTYTLTYDATSDRLTGVYSQVVAKQRFEVTFVRAKPDNRQ